MKLKTSKRAATETRSETVRDDTIPISHCIRLETSRIGRRITIPQQVRFRLDLQVIEQIERNIATNKNLLLPDELKADLRYYALLNLPLKIISSSKRSRYVAELAVQQVQDTPYIPTSQLSFVTDYTDTAKRSTTVLRSRIEFRGVISQQIQQNLWQDCQLYERVARSHYWLTTQIIEQLSLKNTAKKVNSVDVFCWAIIGAIAVVVFCSSLNFGWKIGTCLMFALGYRLILKQLAFKALSKTIIYYLIVKK